MSDQSNAIHISSKDGTTLSELELHTVGACVDNKIYSLKTRQLVGQVLAATTSLARASGAKVERHPEMSDEELEIELHKWIARAFPMLNVRISLVDTTSQ